MSTCNVWISLCEPTHYHSRQLDQTWLKLALVYRKCFGSKHSHLSFQIAKVMISCSVEIFCLWDWCVDVQQLGKENTGVHMIRLCWAESWADSQRQFPSTGPLSRQTWPQKLGPCQPSTLTRLPGVLFWPPSEGSGILLSFKQHFKPLLKVNCEGEFCIHAQRKSFFNALWWVKQVVWYFQLCFFHFVLQLLILKKSLVCSSTVRAGTHTHTQRN